MSRRWMVLSIAGYLLFTGVVAYLWGIVASFNQRRSDNEYIFRKKSEYIYYLASKGDYKGMEVLGLTEPSQFQEIEKKDGKIRSWSIQRVLVRELGLPGYALVRVQRNSSQMECVSFMSRGNASVAVLDSDSQRAIFGTP